MLVLEHLEAPVLQPEALLVGLLAVEVARVRVRDHGLHHAEILAQQRHRAPDIQPHQALHRVLVVSRLQGDVLLSVGIMELLIYLSGDVHGDGRGELALVLGRSVHQLVVHRPLDRWLQYTG